MKKFIPFGENELNSIQIKSSLKHTKNFNGVYSKDILPDLKTGWYIVNLDDHNFSGTHWVCFYYDEKNGNIYYFDSFGFGPPNEIMQKCKNMLYYNNKQIQHLSSSSCGFYCLALIKTNDFEKFLNEFTNVPLINEYKLDNILKTLYLYFI